ncbi:hypothetical protein Hanom_Chr02g00165251 [Helianthus anomalus]
MYNNVTLTPQNLLTSLVFILKIFKYNIYRTHTCPLADWSSSPLTLAKSLAGASIAEE